MIDWFTKFVSKLLCIENWLIWFLMPVKSASKPAKPLRKFIWSCRCGSARNPPALTRYCFQDRWCMADKTFSQARFASIQDRFGSSSRKVKQPSSWASTQPEGQRGGSVSALIGCRVAPFATNPPVDTITMATAFLITGKVFIQLLEKLSLFLGGWVVNEIMHVLDSSQ